MCAVRYVADHPYYQKTYEKNQCGQQKNSITDHANPNFMIMGQVIPNSMIESCRDENSLFNLFINNTSKIDPKRWIAFITQFTIVIKKNDEKLGEIENRISQTLVANRFTFLNKLASGKTPLFATHITNVFFIFRQSLKDCKLYNLDDRYSPTIADYLLFWFRDNVLHFKAHQLYTVVPGLIKLPKTEKLNAAVYALFDRLDQRKKDDETAIVTVIHTYNKLGNFLGLELWRKLNIDKLLEENALKLLRGLKFILPKIYQSDVGFDLDKFIEKIMSFDLAQKDLIELISVISTLKHKCDTGLKLCERLNIDELLKINSLKLLRKFSLSDTNQPYAGSDLDNFYEKFMSFDLTQKDLVEVLCNFLTHKPDTGLKLWKKLNIDELSQIDALNLLLRLKLILPNTNQPYAGFDLDKFIEKIMSFDLTQKDLVEVICTLNTLTYMKTKCKAGLKLWRRINIDNLSKLQALNLLESLSFILQFVNEYYDEFDFEKLVNKIKSFCLTHEEFASIYLWTCLSDYNDEKWDARMQQMLTNQKTDPKVKELLVKAQQYVIQNHNKSIIKLPKGSCSLEHSDSEYLTFYELNKLRHNRVEISQIFHDPTFLIESEQVIRTLEVRKLLN